MGQHAERMAADIIEVSPNSDGKTLAEFVKSSADVLEAVRCIRLWAQDYARGAHQVADWMIEAALDVEELTGGAILAEYVRVICIDMALSFELNPDWREEHVKRRGCGYVID